METGRIETIGKMVRVLADELEQAIREIQTKDAPEVEAPKIKVVPYIYSDDMRAGMQMLHYSMIGLDRIRANFKVAYLDSETKETYEDKDEEELNKDVDKLLRAGHMIISSIENRQGDLERARLDLEKGLFIFYDIEVRYPVGLGRKFLMYKLKFPLEDDAVHVPFDTMVAVPVIAHQIEEVLFSLRRISKLIYK